MESRDRARRRRIAAAILAGLCAAVALWSLVVEPRWIEVTRTRIPVPGLPEGLEGIRIALLADTHHGPWTGEGFIRRVARRTGEERPDIVALAGDFVHRDARYAGPGIAPLAGIEAPLGTYAVLGNHDHWEGAPDASAALVALPGGTLYVTRRLGEISPPVRLGCRPEIAILVLVRAEDPS